MCMPDRMEEPTAAETHRCRYKWYHSQIPEKNQDVKLPLHHLDKFIP